MILEVFLVPVWIDTWIGVLLLRVVSRLIHVDITVPICVVMVRGALLLR